MAANKKTLPALTSLRFFAALGIVLYHANGYFGLPKHSPLVFWGTQPVSFFFVLSGFILFYSYPELNTGAATWRFYVSRWTRIWPTHFLTLIFAILFTPISGSNFIPSEVSLSSIGTFLINISLLQAWIPLAKIYASFNQVSWSISAEFFFYLLFPIALYKWDSRWKWWLFGSGALVIAAIILVQLLQVPGFMPDYDRLTTSGIFHISPFVRFFEFALGMSVGLFFSRKSKAFFEGTFAEVGAILLLLANMFICRLIVGAMAGRGWEGLSAWIAHCGSCFTACFVVYIFACGSGKISKALTWRPLFILGESSFSLYLLHNFYFATFRRGSHPLLALPLPAQFPVFLAGIFFLSYLCWRFWELPMRKWLMGRILKN